METKTDKSKTRKLKHVKIYNELYELIQNGTYEPGSQLPSETTLSATMNVSRMTLRKALTLLREDGLIKDVQGVGHFVREPKAAGSRGRKHPRRAGSADSAAVADAEDSASDEMLSSDGSMTHPVYDSCQEELDSVELDFRIEPPSKSILDNFDHYTAAVVIVDRWYKHEGHTIAYSLSFIPIELVGRLQIDLNSTDALLEFLEHTCYEQGHHCSRCVTYSTAGNFSAKNYKLSSHDSFLMTQENVYDENEEILVVSKHYIPAEVFELKFSIYLSGWAVPGGLHKSQERHFHVQGSSAGNTKGSKILLKSGFPKICNSHSSNRQILKT